LFDYHELWDVVDIGVSALAANATEAHRDQKNKDNKALYLIHQGMNDKTFEEHQLSVRGLDNFVNQL